MNHIEFSLGALSAIVRTESKEETLRDGRVRRNSQIFRDPQIEKEREEII